LTDGLKTSPSFTKVSPYPNNATPSISVDNLNETTPMIEPKQQNYNINYEPYNQNPNNYEYDQNYNNYDMSNNMSNQFYQSNQYSQESQNGQFDQLFDQNGNAQYGQNDTYYNSTNGQYYNNNSYDYNNPSSYNYNQSGHYELNGDGGTNQGYRAVSRSPSPVLNFRPPNQNMQQSRSGLPSTMSQNSLKGAFFNYNVIRNNNNKSNNEDWI